MSLLLDMCVKSVDEAGAVLVPNAGGGVAGSLRRAWILVGRSQPIPSTHSGVGGTVCFVSNDDLAAAKIARSVEIAGWLLVFSGVFGVLHGVQLFGFIRFYTTTPVVFAGVNAVVALAAVVFGAGFVRARGWAVWSAPITGAVLCVLSSVWFVYAFAGLLIVLYAFFIPILALAATIALFLARASCKRTAEARRALAEEGIELGV